MPRGTTGSIWLHSLLLSLVLVSPAFAQRKLEPDRSSESSHPSELTPKARVVVEKGIAWLAKEQRDSSGSWPSKPPRYKMSISALAGLALLAHGDTADTGRYTKNVRKLVKWILRSQEEYAARNPALAGLIFDRLEDSLDDRPMHGHGFALLFLAEAYGNTRDPLLRERMHKGITLGVRLTEKSMSRNGGWYYHPAERRGQQYRDEGSVTITQIQALRSAYNAGIEVDQTVVTQAVNYIKKSQNKKTGGVRYTMNRGKTSAALTAAGVSVLHGVGDYYSDALERGYGYLRLTLDPSKQQSFFYYTHLYGVQAMFQRGGPEWASYFPKIRRELLGKRHGDQPYWKHRFGKSYATSIALLILQVPKRYLPIFQR